MGFLDVASSLYGCVTCVVHARTQRGFLFQSVELLRAAYRCCCNQPRTPVLYNIRVTIVLNHVLCSARLWNVILEIFSCVKVTNMTCNLLFVVA